MPSIIKIILLEEMYNERGDNSHAYPFQLVAVVTQYGNSIDRPCLNLRRASSKQLTTEMLPRSNSIRKH